MGAGRRALVPMNIYPSLLCERHDPRPGLGHQKGQAFLRRSSRPPLPTSLTALLRAEGHGDRAALSTVLEQFQEETHSEPAVVFNFIPTLTSRLSPCTALELCPHWPVPPWRLGNAHTCSGEAHEPVVGWSALCIGSQEWVTRCQLLIQAVYRNRLT